MNLVSHEADWVRQEQVTRGLKASDPRALEGLLKRGGKLVADMYGLGAHDAAGNAKAILDSVASERNGGDTHALYIKARWAIRELALSNPAIDFEELLFVKRQWPRQNHQCSHRMGEAQTPGANLCILERLSPDSPVRDILDAETAKGGVGRPALSYDAKRIAFPYARPRPRPTRYGYGRPGVRGGACIMYDVYEVNIDGTGLRNLTNRPESEDTEPFYLPDGRIGFTTSRDGRFVQCGDWALACGIYTMKPDGSDLYRVTEPKEGEFYPTVLEDGRIMYTRWDYVMKAYNVIQQLWAVNPDGRAAALIYGDHYKFSRGPKAFFEARQIPGTSKVISTGAAHHNTCVGPIMIVDLAQNRGGPEGMTNVTPEFGDRYPEAGGHGTRSKVGWYSSPYPLTENHFLVTYAFDQSSSAARGFALYLADVHGNRDLIYRAPDASCYSPIPLRPRRKPRVIPDMVRGVPPKTPGTLIVTDIYQGLRGVERGTVKHLRVLETMSKVKRTTPQRVDLGVNCGWDVRRVLGTVPVEADGSAHFLVPSGRQLFFEALDGDYLEVRRMRNFMNVMPGETNSCVGCHEPYGTAPMAASREGLLAMKRAPSKIAPPPWGADHIDFRAVVQPVLDKHCIKCHRAEPPEEALRMAKGKKLPVLTGTRMLTAPAPRDRDQGPQHCVSESFLNLIPHVSYVQVGGHYGEATPLALYATGSGASKLMKMLKAGHNKVKLGLAEWRALAAWIDCNAQFYGHWDDICTKPDARPASPRVASPAGEVKPLRSQSSVDKARIAERRKELAGGPGEFLCYIDCGLETSSRDGKTSIVQRAGAGWTFRGAEALRDVAGAHKDITFNRSAIVFEIHGLDPKKPTELNLTWWDFNGAGRRQSVWLAKSPSDRLKKLRDAKPLPGWMNGRKQLPERVTIAIPPDMIDGGKTLVSIRCEGGPSAVLGEMWVVAK